MIRNLNGLGRPGSRWTDNDHPQRGQIINRSYFQLLVQAVLNWFFRTSDVLYMLEAIIWLMSFSNSVNSMCGKHVIKQRINTLWTCRHGHHCLLVQIVGNDSNAVFYYYHRWSNQILTRMSKRWNGDKSRMSETNFGDKYLWYQTGSCVSKFSEQHRCQKLKPLFGNVSKSIELN